MKHTHRCPICSHDEPCPDAAKCREAGTTDVTLICAVCAPNLKGFLEDRGVDLREEKLF